MMLLLVLCLMIGGVTCASFQKGFAPQQYPSNPDQWFATSWSDPNFEPEPAPEPAMVLPAPEEEVSSSQVTAEREEENPDLVFSDVSDLEPVYSYRSRSSYQRGRAVFAQTSYIPGDLAPPPMPMVRRRSQSPKTNFAPAKGGN